MLGREIASQSLQSADTEEMEFWLVDKVEGPL